jgi:predicted molibdopterin-dependent oxidoreductase YjgC
MGSIEGQCFHIEVDGQQVPALGGQTVAAALIASGRRVFRRAPSGAARGLFCGMGVCFECLVTVEGLGEVRACITHARPGMKIRLSLECRGACDGD